MSVCLRLLRILVILLAAGMPCQADTGRTTATYWDTPIPSQSPAPPPPETCGACHADKYSDWQGSRHAHAFSPGLLGQLVDYDPADAAACLDCHAPLAEQQGNLLQDDLENLASNMETQPPGLLAQHGVFCAVCHLRDGVLHAPAISPVDAGGRFHRETSTEPLMQDSRFCASCHQLDASTSVNGKPLQNTYREWQDSSYAEQGKTCQHCHMPNRAHSFRGIHDPEMVRQGLTVSTLTTNSSINLVVQSTGVGHYFPTYSVARVRLTATPFDSASRPIPEGYREIIVQRRMTIEDVRWIELSDTRLRPGESITLSTPRHIGSVCADKTVFQIVVEPEWYYHDQVYPSVIAELEDGPARDLIIEAKAKSEAHRYVLFAQVVSNDCSK